LGTTSSIWKVKTRFFLKNHRITKYNFL